MTLPSLARMTPELATPGATSAASPLCATVIVPALTTRALGSADGRSNFMLPARKLALVMSLGVASRLLALTWEPLAKKIPLGFTRIRLPLALNWPAMVDGLPTLTRLSVVADDEGWTNVVFSPVAILKLCQFMMPLGLD